MDYQYKDDLFEHTKMTFGEHLEELRWSLIKAILALAIGFIIGLFFAGDVVTFVQKPLRESLIRYYRMQGKAELTQRIAGLAGRVSPNEEDQRRADEIVDEGGMLAEERYVDRRALAAALGEQNAAQVDDAKENGADPEDVDINDIDKSPESAAPPSVLAEDLVKILLYYPAEEDPRVRVIGLSVLDGFFVWIKGAILVGVMIASPFVFYFIWEFVAAGLYPHERKYIHLFLPFSIALFLAGAALAFFAVMGLVLDFLFPFYARLGIDPDMRIGEWLNFVLFLPVGFGVSFQLPLVMLFLERIGVFSVPTYLEKWRIAVMVIAVLSMLLTPADPGSMLMMCIPLTILYFGGIALCKYLPKRKTPFGDEVV